MSLRFMLFALMSIPASATANEVSRAVSDSVPVHSPRMDVRLPFVPATIRTEAPNVKSETKPDFLGVFVFTEDFGAEPIPVQSVVVDVGEENCSTGTNTGVFCSVINSGGGQNGKCSVVGTGNSSCSVGYASATLTCSVKWYGRCSIMSSTVLTKFCSISGFLGATAKCSVTVGVGLEPVDEHYAACSAYAKGECSATGSTQNEAASNKCSVHLGIDGSPRANKCSAMVDNKNAKCSAFGTGNGSRFCSVQQIAENYSCTAFAPANAAQCSVLEVQANNKCSVIDSNGNVIGPANGQCDSNFGLPPVGGSWWFHERRKIEWFVVYEGRLRPEIAAAAVLLIGLVLTFRQKSTR